jgi:hypothetical protein
LIVWLHEVDWKRRIISSAESRLNLDGRLLRFLRREVIWFQRSPWFLLRRMKKDASKKCGILCFKCSFEYQSEFIIKSLIVLSWFYWRYSKILYWIALITVLIQSGFDCYLWIHGF